MFLILKMADATSKIEEILKDFDVDLQASIISTVIDEIAIKNDLDIEKLWDTLHETSKDVHRLMGDIDD